MKTLAKEHSRLRCIQSPPGIWTIDPLVPTTWRSLNPEAYVSDTYFDLAGLSMEEKTLFFEGAAVQNWYAPIITNILGAGDSITIFDFMTTSPLSDTELLTLGLEGNFMSGHITFDQTIYGRIRQFVVDVDTQAWGSMVTVNEQQIGSLSATASDRVYSYSVLYFASPIGADTIDISPCRHLLRAEAKEEPEYQYLMRLKRSYELQQEPDVDKA